MAPPQPPEGPLEVFDVHKEGCKVRWNPPLDDGGAPIEAYLLEKLDCETGEWSPCGKTDGELECPVEGLQTVREDYYISYLYTRLYFDTHLFSKMAKCHDSRGQIILLFWLKSNPKTLSG